MSTDTFLLAGLGNPGSKYDGTRHNIGFEIIDEVARRASASMSSGKWDADFAKITLWGVNIYLVKPMTFMNLSGKALARYLDFYKIPLEKFIVIHDDLDMKTGRIKLVSGGGAGGHNGIRSIIQYVGKKDFFRLKMGIGRPGNGLVHEDMAVDKYVLATFLSQEREIIDERISQVILGLEKFFTGSASQSMNYLNSIK